MILQALFPLDSNANLVKEGTIFNTIGLDHHDMISEDESESVPVYPDTLAGGICARKDELDEVIEEHLKDNWHINRVSKMDLMILCIAVSKMTYVTDVPAAVVLNEAAELAKAFGDNRSRKLVNGVLSNVLKELETRT